MKYSNYSFFTGPVWFAVSFPLLHVAPPNIVVTMSHLPDSPVSIVTADWTAGVRSPTEAEYFYSTVWVSPALGPIQPATVGTGDLPRR
jgi:hypothetical protein